MGDCIADGGPTLSVLPSSSELAKKKEKEEGEEEKWTPAKQFPLTNDKIETRDGNGVLNSTSRGLRRKVESIGTRTGTQKD